MKTKTIFIKIALFSLIATALFFLVNQFLYESTLFRGLTFIGVIVTIFSFLAFIFCLIFNVGNKKTDINIGDQNKE